jgi:hypothetical protein
MPFASSEMKARGGTEAIERRRGADELLHVAGNRFRDKSELIRMRGGSDATKRSARGRVLLVLVLLMDFTYVLPSPCVAALRDRGGAVDHSLTVRACTECSARPRADVPPSL